MQPFYINDFKVLCKIFENPNSGNLIFLAEEESSKRTKLTLRRVALKVKKHTPQNKKLVHSEYETLCKYHKNFHRDDVIKPFVKIEDRDYVGFVMPFYSCPYSITALDASSDLSHWVNNRADLSRAIINYKDKFRDPPQLIILAKFLFTVMRYLHSIGIEYLDFKPENILCTVNGFILIDFDSVKKIKTYEKSNLTNEENKKNSGTELKVGQQNYELEEGVNFSSMYTEKYCAPEQLPEQLSEQQLQKLENILPKHLFTKLLHRSRQSLRETTLEKVPATKHSDYYSVALVLWCAVKGSLPPVTTLQRVYADYYTKSTLLEPLAKDDEENNPMYKFIDKNLSIATFERATDIAEFDKVIEDYQSYVGKKDTVKQDEPPNRSRFWWFK